MPRPTTFIAQPAFRLQKSKPANKKSSVTVLSLYKLSLAPCSAYRTKSTPTPLPLSLRALTAAPFFSPPAAAAPSKTVIVWFRSDLRVHDHPALVRALEEAASGPVLPLFIFDPRNFEQTPSGFKKTGRYRAKFLIDSVITLRHSLQKRGSDLLIRIGHPEQVLPRLAAQVGAHAVFCHNGVSLEESKRESILQSQLHRAGVQFQPLWSNTLYHIDDLPFPIDKLPDAYTTYREQVQTQSQIRPPLAAPKAMPRLPRIELGDVPSLQQLGLTEPCPKTSAMSEYIGGETEALKKLDAYVKGISTERSGHASSAHLGAEFSCHISPWLALGCVSPRQIYADLTEAAPEAKQTTTYFELMWRDFFRYVSVRDVWAKLSKPQTFPASASVM